MEMLERTFRNGPLDFAFPWHMQLGRFEQKVKREVNEENEDGDFAYTPFKVFNRRRNFLVLMLSNKFDFLYSDEEREKLKEIEARQFQMSVALKGLSIFSMMHLRFLWRPVGRPILFDLSLIYFSLYCFLGSNIPGVFMTWPEYMPLAKRMFDSKKLQKGGKRNLADFLDETHLQPDYKAVYYKYDMLLSHIY